MTNLTAKIIGTPNGYCAHLRVGDTPASTYQMAFANPVSDPHLGWMLRYAENLGNDARNARFAAASALETFDHLLSDDINMDEAMQRLRLLRAARRELVSDAAALPSHADQPL